ncbi:hypothetical protein [Vibrio phage JSF12]|uniref:DUF7265 domain-containing protein n=2 Tax=Jesfedecavirus TaxID=2560156 RepID=A0A2D0Z3W5_9CAUD|nr:L-shaped tail fiber protein assembly [Vibrio phage JSF10]YP_009794803.1 L-shaped tail fiber protein assembly [Vibrio phage JSF12]ASV43461.1 hypothetical protein [Vibrio phage JSF10]ASV43638.1 hypothetical protein [Vibrio phage JSF12]
MSGILNINIQEGATFSKALSFKKTVAVTSGTHPITKEPIVVSSKVPLDITGVRLVAQIRDKFDTPTFVQDITCNIMDGASGRAYMGLSREQTTRLAQVAKLTPAGVGCSRTFKIGFYDLLAIDVATGTSTKLFFGTVYLTRSATEDENLEINPDQSIARSPVTPINQSVTIPVDSSVAKYYVGIRYFKSGVAVTPTSGSVQLFRKPLATPVMGTTPVGTFLANTPSQEIYITGNTLEFKATPVSVLNADSYQMVVVGNLY